MRSRDGQQLITSCSFDIETSSLDADFGIMLCGVVKPSGEKPKVFRLDKLSKTWSKKRSDDSAVVRAFNDELNQYDVVAGHNGVRFDICFLRTRALEYKLPPLRDFKAVIDPVQIARNKLKLSSNSLDRLTDFLGTNTKTRVDGKLWRQASLDGSKKAMDAICDHCLNDVYMLEDLVVKIKAYVTKLNSWGSAY